MMIKGDFKVPVFEFLVAMNLSITLEEKVHTNISVGHTVVTKSYALGRESNVDEH